MHILLVDDDAMALRVIGSALKERGHHLRTASNGLDALRCIEERMPDLVICDIQMPGMDGLTLLRTTRKGYPDMPIILVTGDRDVETAVAGFRSGASDYLKKPVDFRELLDCIHHIERRHSIG